MKTLIMALALTLLPTAVLAAHKLPASYRAIYCYPGGSYWVKQIAAYPDYYADHNSYYVSHYGSATRYCPV